jgi:hypothetical protein
LREGDNAVAGHARLPGEYAMPRAMTDIDTLQEYIRAVIEKSEHHAKGVDEAALALIGMIVWRKDSDRELQVLERDREMKNVLWVWISGEKYALSYDHELQEIQIRERTLRGDALKSFDNSAPIEEIKRFFAKL